MAKTTLEIVQQWDSYSRDRIIVVAEQVKRSGIALADLAAACTIANRQEDERKAKAEEEERRRKSSCSRCRQPWILAEVEQRRNLHPQEWTETRDMNEQELAALRARIERDVCSGFFGMSPDFVRAKAMGLPLTNKALLQMMPNLQREVDERFHSWEKKVTRKVTRCLCGRWDEFDRAKGERLEREQQEKDAAMIA